MFETALAWLSTAGLILVGLIARAALAILILAVIVVPISVALVGWTWLVRLVNRASGLRRVGHITWREGCYYTPGHLWLRPSGGGALRIGIDDLAQRVLPDISAVMLPMAGAAVRKGEPLGTIRCPDGAVTLRSPISGTIAAVNARLEKVPSLLHRDPYRRAWMVELRPQNGEYETLPAGAAARAWLAREDGRLTAFFEPRLGLAAADGGELILPPHKLLSPAEWEAVRAGFLGDWKGDQEL